MATFVTPIQAIKAAINMLREIETFNLGISQRLTLKIGIHKGHSIAVTLNDRLDYFCQTVNIASRVQGLAGANEIYVSQEIYDYPGVPEVLSEYDTAAERVVLKGVSEKIESKPNELIKFQVITGPARPVGTYLFKTLGSSTQVTLILDFQPKGLAKLMDPMITSSMQSEVAMLSNLKSYLESH